MVRPNKFVGDSSEAATWLAAFGAASPAKEFSDGPPRPGLVPKTGDPQHPGRWLRPDTATAHDPDPERSSAPHDAADPGGTHTLAELARDFPEAAADAKTWGSVRSAVGRVRSAVYGWAVRQTPAVWEALHGVLDSPEEMSRFGYAPGGTNPKGDALQGATGISTHLAVKIASSVLSKAWVFAKSKAGKNMSDAPADVAAALAELFGLVNQALGGQVFVTDPGEITARLGEDSSSFAADASGHEHKGKGEGGGQFTGKGEGGGESGATADKGKPSEPASDDKPKAAPIHSPAFKSWFGDWESDPAGASKVVNLETGEPQETHELPAGQVKDGDGKPVVVYHGTAGGGFNAFDKKKADPNGLYGPGFYFTEDRKVAEEYMTGGTSQTYQNIVVPPDQRQGYLEAFEKAASDAGVSPHHPDSSWSWEKHKREFLSRGTLYFLGGNVINDERMKIAVRLGPKFKAASVETRGKNKGKESPLETKEVYLNIRKPFRIDGTFTPAEVERIAGTKLRIPNPVPGDHSGQSVYNALCEHAVYSLSEADRAKAVKKHGGNYAAGKAMVEPILARAGYDGITHVGGDLMGGGHHHRVWIAFEPTQIKATDNTGTFDPSNPDMRFSADASGHEHAPKGSPEGGRFTGKGEGGAGSEEPKGDAPSPAPLSPHAQTRSALDALGIPHAHLTDEELHKQLSGALAPKEAKPKATAPTAHLDTEIATLRAVAERAKDAEGVPVAEVETIMARLSKLSAKEVEHLAAEVANVNVRGKRAALDMLQAKLTEGRRIRDSMKMSADGDSFAADAKGHEHRGSGEGGGQFAPKGGDKAGKSGGKPPKVAKKTPPETNKKETTETPAETGSAGESKMADQAREIVKTIKPSKVRAFTGEAAGGKIDSRLAGAIGEEILIQHLKGLGYTDAKQTSEFLKTPVNNLPIDLIHDHRLIEAKAGQASNPDGVWALKYDGKFTQAQEAKFAKMTPEKVKVAKKRINAAKVEGIHARKAAFIERMNKELGFVEKAGMMCVLVNPDTKTADLYEFDGFHDRIPFKSEQAQQAYVGSVKYG